VFFRIYFVVMFVFSYSFGSVKNVAHLNTKINDNKKQYNEMLNTKNQINKNINSLATKIKSQKKSYKMNNIILNNINKKIIKNKLKLRNSVKKLKKLKSQSLTLKQRKTQIEEVMVDFIIKKYSMSLGIKQKKKKTINNLVDKEVYSLIFADTKEKILNLNIDFLQTNNKIKQNEKTTNNITHFIKKQDKVKKRYIKLKEKQKKTISSLKGTQGEYKKQLIKIQEKQDKLTDLLGNLDILKKKEIKTIRAQQAIDEAKQRKKLLAKKKQELAKLKRKKEKDKQKRKKIKELESKIIRLSSKKELDIKVRNLGSSARGVKILKYTGKKTISPLRSYVITKKFGKYFDSVYKMKLFNESVSLKTRRPNAKVYNVFKGKIVYAKEHSGLLDNVVIVKHKNNLHTIYSHLDKISPTIRVGKWIPKGYVVGRVSDTLQFQATKNSKYINPTLLFR